MALQEFVSQLLRRIASTAHYVNFIVNRSKLFYLTWVSHHALEREIDGHVEVCDAKLNLISAIHKAASFHQIRVLVDSGEILDRDSVERGQLDLGHQIARRLTKVFVVKSSNITTDRGIFTTGNARRVLSSEANISELH